MNGFTMRLVQAGLFLFLALIPIFTTTTRAEEAGPPDGLDMGKSWTGDFDVMAQRRLVRILVPYNKTIYFIDKGEEFGTAVDLGRAFEKALNQGKKSAVEQIRVAFVPVPRDRLLPALAQGLGDIAAGGLTITSTREALVDFSRPFADNIKEVLVTARQPRPWRKSRILPAAISMSASRAAIMNICKR
ncbi:transporter substrate-binding domain-containing protein [Nordella sp. HKS 07]|uniref:transporter substrate-binding domain-containing protein n=1 Tax=Nordella sp. HKS 07 TaxID=2712222 RepID=UPI002110B475|nr:transporter substrate-binding domain-containing protein [Nordella sp. HKS 07]